jgi:hypothetical protein
LSLTCIYAQKNASISLKDASDFQKLSATVYSLREELESVKSELAQLRDSQHTVHTAGKTPNGKDITTSTSDIRASASLHPGESATTRKQAIEQFRGPTSSVYSFNVAKSSLHIIGIDQNPIEENDLVIQDTQSRSDKTDVERPVLHPFEDPVWSLNLADALRLARLYDEECGTLYPTTEIEPVMAHIHWLLDPPGPRTKDPSELDSAGKDLTDMTKIIIAIGLLLEGDGKAKQLKDYSSPWKPLSVRRSHAHHPYTA